MKIYTAKTVDEALEQAAQEQGVAINELIYAVSDKKKGIFNKKIIVEVYDLSDIVRFAEDYVLNVIDNLGIESTLHTVLDNEIIRITIDSTHNPVLIGKNGRTLQALNELVKLAVSNHFKKRFRILLDINGYKDEKYARLKRIARKCAREVQKTKTTYTFDPMPADERRVVHNALSGMPHIRTESIGEDSQRKLQIIYVE